MKEIQSPNNFKLENSCAVFLGGSIEMGAAAPWQAQLLVKFNNSDIVFLNPRRTDWDSTWVQQASNPQFVEQVNWELDALEYSDIVVFYFDPATKSPITLMELGLFANKGKHVIVCCPQGFWRKGNVDIVCSRNGITVVEDFDSLVSMLKSITKI